MNISNDVMSAPYGFEKLVRQERTQPEDGIPKDFFTSIAEEEEKKEQGSLSGGLPFPEQMSKEERARVELLKNQAEQIASQADGGLNASQEAQIRDIEKEIGKISGMPMGEDLVAKAKKQAEANKKELEPDEQEEQEAQENAFQTATQGGLDMGDPSAVRMIGQNALVTSIKTAGSALKSSSFKSTQ